MKHIKTIFNQILILLLITTIISCTSSSSEQPNYKSEIKRLMKNKNVIKVDVNNGNYIKDSLVSIDYTDNGVIINSADYSGNYSNYQEEMFIPYSRIHQVNMYTKFNKGDTKEYELQFELIRFDVNASHK